MSDTNDRETAVEALRAVLQQIDADGLGATDVERAYIEGVVEGVGAGIV